MKEYTQIPGFENYGISKDGEVKNLKTERILKTTTSANGYPTVGLCKKGTVKVISVHSLMAQIFLNHTPNYITVPDHINGIKTDNRLENLHIITQRQNVSKEITRALPTGVYDYTKNRYRARITYNKKLHTIGIFDTPEEAHQAYLAAIPN